MNEEVIKDFYNRIIGYIRTDNNGNKQVFDFYRRPLGSYNKAQNVTKDFYNRIVGRGDMAVALIYRENARREAERNRK